MANAGTAIVMAAMTNEAMDSLRVFTVGLLNMDSEVENLGVAGTMTKSRDDRSGWLWGYVRLTSD
jgi:hypothetical protein